MLLEPPDGIIITISQQMLKEKGYRNWLKNFFRAMAEEDHTYWMKLGSQPKYEVMWVYLCIGNRIRYRANFVMSHGPGWMTFGDRNLYSHAWVVLCGPLVKPDHPIPRKGFRGFRYTQKLF